MSHCKAGSQWHSFSLYIMVSSLPHTQVEDWEREVHACDLECPGDQTQSHTLPWPTALSACRAWCVVQPCLPDFFTHGFFFQGAVFSPFRFTSWAKNLVHLPSLYNFWFTVFISNSLPCASLNTHQGQSWPPVSECLVS